MKICISGITGQIGAIAAEVCLALGHQVYGLKRRSSSFNTARLDHMFDNPNLKLVFGDITDFASVASFVQTIQPDIYLNMAAQSHVAVSFNNPIYSADATGMSVLNTLEAIRQFSPKTRFITMSSSEMYGSVPPKQNEKSEFHPRQFMLVPNYLATTQRSIIEKWVFLHQMQFVSIPSRNSEAKVF